MAEPLTIDDLRGGLNDTQTPPEIRPDQLVVCTNIDFDQATCGGKRRGTSPVSNGYAGPILTPTVLYRHHPVNDEHLTELWMAGATVSGALPASGSSAPVYRNALGWAPSSGMSWGLDDLATASGLYDIEFQSLHGKLFAAYTAVSGGSLVDRLHVRETSPSGITQFRRAGIREPAVPTVQTDGSGAYATTRYIRVRYTAQDGSGNTLRRSEPSDEVTFTPPGTGSGMKITRGALLGEGETHWEVELAVDVNGDGSLKNFYRVTTLPLATQDYTDTTAASADYAGVDNPLSEDIGDYTLIWAPKFLGADEDRLLYAGSRVNAAYKSRVGWTPVAGGPGVGNDERLELDTDPYLDLDGFDGGELTGFKGPINGYFYAFKWEQIYKLVRTGVRKQSYQAVPVTKTLGALPGSVVSGFDEAGQPCLYFADPLRGGHRIGANGLEDLGEDVRTTWGRLNLDATVPCRSVFYPEKRQWHLWIAVDGALFPNLKMVLHVKYVRRTEEGGKRGWAVHTGKSAHALAACLYADNLASVPSSGQSLRLKPYFGLPAGIASGASILQQMDTGVADDGETYAATMRTKPFILGNLMQRKGVTAGAIMAEAVSGGTVDVSVIRDYARETITRHVSLTAPSGQARIVAPIDSLSLSDVMALQLEIGDAAATSGTWSLDQIALLLRDEERS